MIYTNRNIENTPFYVPVERFNYSAEHDSPVTTIDMKKIQNKETSCWLIFIHINLQQTSKSISINE